MNENVIAFQPRKTRVNHESGTFSLSSKAPDTEHAPHLTIVTAESRFPKQESASNKMNITCVVISGTGTLTYFADNHFSHKDMKPGDQFFIPRGTPYALKNIPDAKAVGAPDLKLLFITDEEWTFEKTAKVTID